MRHFGPGHVFFKTHAVTSGFFAEDLSLRLLRLSYPLSKAQPALSCGNLKLQRLRAQSRAGEIIQRMSRVCNTYFRKISIFSRFRVIYPRKRPDTSGAASRGKETAPCNYSNSRELLLLLSDRRKDRIDLFFVCGDL